MSSLLKKQVKQDTVYGDVSVCDFDRSEKEVAIGQVCSVSEGGDKVWNVFFWEVYCLSSIKEEFSAT